MKSKTLLSSLILGAALATMPVQAANSDLPIHAAQEVGRYIAAQGNAALIQIREDMKQGLLDALKPMLPEPKQRAAAIRKQPSQH